MLNSVVMWMCGHPLQFVGGLVAVAGGVAVAFSPRLGVVHDCGHPRC
jgi:hypothetical protein